MSGCISLEESTSRSLISGRLEVLCKRNDSHENKASVVIFLVCNHCFGHSNVPAKKCGPPTLFYFAEKSVAILPFVDPVLKLYIHCEFSGRSRGVAWGAWPPLIITLIIRADLDDWAPPLSEGLDPPLESMLFGF